MITLEQFNQLKNEYGDVASFAVWSSWHYVGDTSMFDSDTIIKLLNNRFIFVALNPAERPPTDKQVPKFKNFHSDYSYQKDYKLAFALQNTKFYGAYITDLFKSFRITKSELLSKELKARPADVQKDVEKLCDEINILNPDAVLIALGRKVEKYLKKLFRDRYTIIYLKHYSFYCSKEKYRELVEKLEMVC